MRALVCGSLSALTLAACSLVTDLDGYAGSAAALIDGGGPETSSPPAPPPSTGLDAGADADAGPSYRAAVLADSPIAYWPLDDDSGSLVARDVVGNHDATLSGAGKFAVAGVSGTAFSGTGGSFDVANPIGFTGDAPYTFEAWAIPTYTGQYQNIFDRRAGGNGYVLYFRDTGAVQLEQIWSNGTRGGWFDVPKSTKFQHVVATFDGTTFRLYIDGVQSPSTYQATGGPAPQTGGMAIADAYTGVLDELAVYDHALAPERVTLHHKLGTGGGSGN